MKFLTEDQHKDVHKLWDVPEGYRICGVPHNLKYSCVQEALSFLTAERTWSSQGLPPWIQQQSLVLPNEERIVNAFLRMPAVYESAPEFVCVLSTDGYREHKHTRLLKHERLLVITEASALCSLPIRSSLWLVLAYDVRTGDLVFLVREDCLLEDEVLQWCGRFLEAMIRGDFSHRKSPAWQETRYPLASEK